MGFVEEKLRPQDQRASRDFLAPGSQLDVVNAAPWRPLLREVGDRHEACRLQQLTDLIQLREAADDALLLRGDLLGAHRPSLDHALRVPGLMEVGTKLRARRLLVALEAAAEGAGARTSLAAGFGLGDGCEGGAFDWRLDNLRGEESARLAGDRLHARAIETDFAPECCPCVVRVLLLAAKHRLTTREVHRRNRLAGVQQLRVLLLRQLEFPAAHRAPSWLQSGHAMVCVAQGSRYACPAELRCWTSISPVSSQVRQEKGKSSGSSGGNSGSRGCSSSGGQGIAWNGSRQMCTSPSCCTAGWRCGRGEAQLRQASGGFVNARSVACIAISKLRR